MNWISPKRQFWVVETQLLHERFQIFFKTWHNTRKKLYSDEVWYAMKLYTATTLIPYTMVTLIYCQTLSKKHTFRKIDINNLSVCSWQGLLIIFFDKRDNFVYKNENFYNPTITKVLTTIIGIPHQPFQQIHKPETFIPEALKKSGGLLQIGKATESSDDDAICHLLSLEDAVALQCSSQY